MLPLVNLTFNPKSSACNLPKTTPDPAFQAAPSLRVQIWIITAELNSVFVGIEALAKIEIHESPKLAGDRKERTSSMTFSVFGSESHILHWKYF